MSVMSRSERSPAVITSDPGLLAAGALLQARISLTPFARFLKATRATEYTALWGQ
jgi:hypothetical protein